MTPEIAERLARIEENQKHTLELVKKMDAQMDAHDDRLRGIELKSAGAASIVGGIVSIGIAYASAKITGKA